MKATGPGISVFDEQAFEYDRWFDENRSIYEAEIKALKRYVPQEGLGLEVGIGTGRFAVPFNVKVGVDPAHQALKKDFDRRVSVCQAYGEQLPFRKDQFDFLLLITVDPFVADFRTLLEEAYRVLLPEGHAILGVTDKDSPLGKIYEGQKEGDPFYRAAHFHSANEIRKDLEHIGFESIQTCQTVLGLPNSMTTTGKICFGLRGDYLGVKNGYGEGAFVVFCAQKPHIPESAK